jgi:drug/metabolite transporter (DMT)-like permease
MPSTPSRAKIITAFAAVYLIWGSTYLAILYAIETLPPFLMAGARFVTAGILIYAWSRGRASTAPTRSDWRAALIVGGLLLLGGNGAVVWAEQTVPSGIAALLVAITPCWMVLLDWLWRGAERPGARTIAGLLLGFGGIALLVGPSTIMCGSLAWATGSIYSKKTAAPAGALLFTGMQMLAGGALLLLAGALTGELARLDPGAVSLRSLLALAYLLVFGSIIGYTAYVWLLRVSTPARVSTYAYVNPIVAVLLGWALAGESLTMRMGFAALIIIVGVALITLEENSRQGARKAAAADAARRAA